MTSFCLQYGILGVSLLFALTLAGEISFKDCARAGSPGGIIHSVDISGCTKYPCILKRSTYTNMTMDFTATMTAKAVKVKVFGYVLGYIKVNYGLPDENACHFLKRCPLVEDVHNTLKVSVFTKPSFPLIKMPIEWELIDASTWKTLICFRLPVQIAE